MENVKASAEPKTGLAASTSAEQIGLLILNELRALRNELKEGGKNVREALDNVICSDLISRQCPAETVEIEEQAGSSSSQQQC